MARLRLDYDECPCAELGKDGSYDHNRIVGFIQPKGADYKFRVCANHKRNYTECRDLDTNRSRYRFTKIGGA